MFFFILFYLRFHGALENSKEFYLQFFVDIVTEFCFSSEKAFKSLDKETVLPRIMNYAFNRESSATKRFSPLEDYGVDESPVVRSFILQQLLSRYNYQLTIGNFYSFFKQSLVEENFNFLINFDFKEG